MRKIAKAAVVLTFGLVAAPTPAAHKEKGPYQAAEFYGDEEEKDGMVCRGSGTVDGAGNVGVSERCRDHYIHIYKVQVGNTVYLLGGSEALIGTLKGTPLSIRFSKNQMTVFVLDRYNKEARYHLLPGTFYVKN